MPVWQIDLVDDRPDVTLRGWAAFEVPLHGLENPWTRHVAGWSCEDHQGQVCSALHQFDPRTGQCLTESGRVYRLLGKPGLGADAEYVWNRWRRIANVGEHRDVTREFFEAIRAAQASRPSAQGARS